MSRYIKAVPVSQKEVSQQTKIDRLQAAGDGLAEMIQAEIDDAENSLKYFSNPVNIDTLQTWIANRKTKLAAWNQAKEMT